MWAGFAFGDPVLLLDILAPGRPPVGGLGAVVG